MNINSVRSNDILQAIYFGNLNSGVKGTSNATGNISSRFSVDKVAISSFGQLLSKIESNLSAEDQTAVKDFFKEVRSAIKSGSFDAASLAESAPESLTSLAKENEINIEDVLNKLNEKANELKSRFGTPMMQGAPPNSASNGGQAPPPPPPPGGMGGMVPMGQLISKAESTLSTEDQTALEKYLEEVKAAIDNGNFDAKALADNAPDSLKSLANDNGINLEDFLNALNDKVTELKNRTNTIELNSISEDKTQIKDFFKQVANAIKGDNFDAKALADNAPDSLKQYLQIRGINLEDMLNALNNNENETQTETGVSTT